MWLPDRAARGKLRQPDARVWAVYLFESCCIQCNSQTFQVERRQWRIKKQESENRKLRLSGALSCDGRKELPDCIHLYPGRLKSHDSLLLSACCLALLGCSVFSGPPCFSPTQVIHLQLQLLPTISHKYSGPNGKKSIGGLMVEFSPPKRKKLWITLQFPKYVACLPTSVLFP